MIHQRIIKPGRQVGGARARRRDTDAETSGKLGIGGRHEGCHLLVTGLNEPDLAVRTVKRAKHAINAITGIAENVADAPLLQTLNQEIADCLGHGTSRSPMEFNDSPCWPGEA